LPCTLGSAKAAKRWLELKSALRLVADEVALEHFQRLGAGGIAQQVAGHQRRPAVGAAGLGGKLIEIGFEIGPDHRRPLRLGLQQLDGETAIGLRRRAVVAGSSAMAVARHKDRNTRTMSNSTLQANTSRHQARRIWRNVGG
jgi:hypothetical protein